MIETRTIIAKSFDMKQFLLVVLFSIYSMSAAIAQSNVVKGSAIFIKPTDEFYKQAKEYNQLIKENSIWGYIKHLPSRGKMETYNNR